jgi:hypothetical protein
MWNKAGGQVLQGLKNRREDERKLFLTPAKPAQAARPDPAPIPPPPDIEPPADEPAKEPAKSIAGYVLAAAAALIAALATWIMKG